MKHITTYTVIVGLLFVTLLFSCSPGVSLAEYESLQADYDEVCSDLEDTEVELEIAEEALAESQSALESYQAGVTQLQVVLADTQSTLTATQTNLSETEAELAAVQAELDDMEDDLTSAEDSLAVAQTALTDSQFYADHWESESTYWEAQYETIHGSYHEFVDWYDELRDSVHEKFGWNEDMQLFITPDNESVEDLVIDVTGGYSEDVNERWADYERMYDWVVDNIQYNSDSRMPYLPTISEELEWWFKEYWRLPSETLDDEVGDCEDMAVLLASMLRNYDSETTAKWCITWQSDESGHAAVAFPVSGNELTIIDPAGNYYTSSFGSLSSDPIQDAVDDWLAHWSGQPGIYIDGVFSNYFHESFSSTAEFVTWVNDWFDS